MGTDDCEKANMNTNNDAKVNMGDDSDNNASDEKSVVPDGGWGWAIVFASFFIHFLMDGITYSMGLAFMDDMLIKVSGERSWVSAVFSILPAVTLGAQPIATVFTNMYGCRRVAIVGSFIAAFGYALSRLWANIWFYYLTISVIGGFGFALMYLPAIVSVGLYFEKRRALAMGIAVAGSGVGTIVFNYVLGRIIKSDKLLSYENALLLEAGLILLGVVSGFLMRPLPQERSEQRKRQKQAEKKKAEQLLCAQNGSTACKDGADYAIETNQKVVITEKSFFGQIIEQIDMKLLKNMAFVLFVITNFLSSLGFNVIYNFADDLANDLKVNPDHRAYILMSTGLFNVLGRIVLGFIGDLKSVNRLLLFIVTLVMSGVATVAAPLCGSSVFPHIGYGSVFGFFSGGYVALTAIILVDLVGVAKLSDAFGVVMLFVGVATIIGSPIVGKMRDAFSTNPRPYLWPYAIMGCFSIVGGVILFLIPYLQRKKSAKKEADIPCDDMKFGDSASNAEKA